MGIRDTLNKNRQVTIGVVSVVALGALVFVIREALHSDLPPIPTQAYYTIDDGATYFADDLGLVPPFDHDGKQAVRIQMYKCGNSTFPGYLTRYTPEAKQQIEAAHGVGVGSIMAAGTEIKAPLTGNSGWIGADKPGSAKVYAVHCPDGSQDVPQPIMP